MSSEHQQYQRNGDDRYETVYRTQVITERVRVCRCCRKQLPSLVENKNAYRTAGSLVGSVSTSYGGSIAGASMGAIAGPIGVMVGGLSGALVGAVGGSMLGAKTAETAVEVVENHNQDEFCSDECRKKFQSLEKNKKDDEDEKRGNRLNGEEDEQNYEQSASTSNPVTSWITDTWSGVFGTSSNNTEDEQNQSSSSTSSSSIIRKDGMFSGQGYRLGGNSTNGDSDGNEQKVKHLIPNINSSYQNKGCAERGVHLEDDETIIASKEGSQSSSTSIESNNDISGRIKEEHFIR